MNIPESIREWIEKRIEEEYGDLDGIQLAITGEEADVTPPFIAIYETSSSQHEAGGVMMDGVTDFEIAVELQTVPTDANNAGTPNVIEEGFKNDIYNILADRSIIDYADNRNNARIFDIRTSSSVTEPGEGRRVTRWELTVIACPA